VDPAALVLLPNAVLLPSGVPDASGRRLVSALFLGRIGYRKGAFDIIRAAARLPPDVRSRCRIIRHPHLHR